MSLNIYHPSHMPATCDLSPTKTKMILDWLKSSEHYRNWSDIDARLYESPHFCEHAVFAYEDRESNSFNGDKIRFNSNPEGARNRPILGDSVIAHKFANIARQSILADGTTNILSCSETGR